MIDGKINMAKTASEWQEKGEVGYHQEWRMIHEVHF